MGFGPPGCVPGAAPKRFKPARRIRSLSQYVDGIWAAGARAKADLCYRAGCCGRPIGVARKPTNCQELLSARRVIREIVMMRLVCLFGAFLLAGVVAPSAFAKGPFGKIRVGDWRGGAYTNDQTGAFSHCTALGRFPNDTILAVSQHADGA
jgi:hypothetical protein